MGTTEVKRIRRNETKSAAAVFFSNIPSSKVHTCSVYKQQIRAMSKPNIKILRPSFFSDEGLTKSNQAMKKRANTSILVMDD